MALTEEQVKAAYGARCDPRQMERYDFLGWSIRVRVGTWPVWDLLAWSCKEAGVHMRSQVWSYNCRRIEGSSEWSMHAYGLALDLNAPRNGRGLPRQQSEMRHVAAVLERHERNVGFVVLRWGATGPTPTRCTSRWRAPRARCRPSGAYCARRATSPPWGPEALTNDR